MRLLLYQIIYYFDKPSQWRTEKTHLFRLVSCSGTGSVDTSAVMLATVCGELSLGVLVELFGFSFSSTGDVPGFEDKFSFVKADAFKSSLTAFSTPLVTIFSTGVAEPLARLRERLTSFAWWTSLLLSPSSSESEYSSWCAMCLSDARTAMQSRRTI